MSSRNADIALTLEWAGRVLDGGHGYTELHVVEVLYHGAWLMQTMTPDSLVARAAADRWAANDPTLDKGMRGVRIVHASVETLAYDPS